jgi:hypothetical protein
MPKSYPNNHLMYSDISQTFYGTRTFMALYKYAQNNTLFFEARSRSLASRLKRTRMPCCVARGSPRECQAVMRTACRARLPAAGLCGTIGGGGRMRDVR